MRSLKTIFFFLVLLVSLVGSSAYGQVIEDEIEEEPSRITLPVFKKQIALMADLNTTISLYFINFSFEYLHRNSFVALGFKLTGGYVTDNFYSDNKEFYGAASYIMLFGREKHFFENNLGLLYSPNLVDIPIPTTMIGYRFQPSGKLILRGGIGFPMGLYLGLGVRF